MNNDRHKFRVFSKELRKYVGAGCLDINGILFSVDEFEHPSDGDLPLFEVTDLDLSKFIIEQCTGLKDKHDRLIFEGDILDSRPFQPEIYAVEADIYHGLRFVVGRSQICKADAEYGEVIGNIHEHAHLLEAL